jgi:hypothetical protein
MAVNPVGRDSREMLELALSKNKYIKKRCNILH